jgi:hypothetical protein
MMRVLDPLGAESTEGSLQNRLFPPVLSIAITQRLRYLSYWAWVTSYLEKHTDEERALYEKVLLVASINHDCPDSPIASSGVMSSSSLEAQLSDRNAGGIDISAEAFTIAGQDVARFDNYYKGILYRLLLFEDEWTLTPLGEQLAEAYDAAVDFSFDEVNVAVEHERLPMNLVERATSSGCLCQLTDSEREILTRAYFYLVEPTSHYEELAFGRDPGPDILSLQEYIGNSASPDTESEAAVEATLAEVESVGDEAYNEDLDLFFESGRDAFARGSLVLLIKTGDWVQRRRTPEPQFDVLADTREAWRLLAHVEYASFALQSLFVTLMEAVRTLEPVTPDRLMATIFADPEFDEAVGRALAGVELSEREDGSRSVLTGVRDAVYFGEAPERPLDVSVAEDASPFSGTWADACADLQSADPTDDPFVLSEYSERAYRELISKTLSEPASLTKCRRVAAYSTVQLARLSSRYSQYFNDDEVAPFVDWLRTAHEDPNVMTCWRLNAEHERSLDFLDYGPRDNWETSAFSLTAARFARQWILDHYFERLFDKIENANGRSPHLLHVDSDGRLTFDHEINGGRVYNGGYPNAPTLKFARLGDILYELDLINDTDLDEMRVTDRGRQLVTVFTGGEDS